MFVGIEMLVYILIGIILDVFELYMYWLKISNFWIGDSFYVYIIVVWKSM